MQAPSDASMEIFRRDISKKLLAVICVAYALLAWRETRLGTSPQGVCYR